MKSLTESMKGFQKSLDNETEMLCKHLEKQVERQEAAIDRLMSMMAQQAAVLNNLPMMLKDAVGERSRESSRRSSWKERGHSTTWRNHRYSYEQHAHSELGSLEPERNETRQPEQLPEQGNDRPNLPLSYCGEDPQEAQPAAPDATKQKEVAKELDDRQKLNLADG